MRALILAVVLVAGADTSRPRGETLGVQASVPLPARPNALSMSPDGRRLAVACREGHVRVVHADTGVEIAALPVSRHGADSVAWSPDGDTLAVTDAREMIQLVDAATFKQRHHLLAEGGAVALAWKPDGTMLAGGGARALRLWDPTHVNGPRSLEAGDGIVTGLAWSDDGRRLFTLSSDGVLRTWDVSAGAPLYSTTFDLPLHSVASSGDGSRAIVGDYGGTVWMIDPATGKRLWNADLFDNTPVTGLAFLPNGRQAIAAAGGTIVIFRTSDGGAEGRYTAHRGTIRAIAVEPRGRWIATAADDGALKIWRRVSDGAPSARPVGDPRVRLHARNGAVCVRQSGAASLKSGDVLLRIGREQVRSTDQANELLNSYFEGDEVDIAIRRGDRDMTIRFRLSPMPENRR